MLVIVTVIAIGTMALALAIPRLYLREPAPAGAAIMRADWDKTYACGPAYVLGYLHPAHAIGLYFGRGVIGVSYGDFEHAQWVDHDRLRQFGAVIVETAPNLMFPSFARAFPQMTPPKTIALPYRRSLRSAEHTYVYRFVPPQGC
jgi:hypothetical protein